MKRNLSEEELFRNELDKLIAMIREDQDDRQLRDQLHVLTSMFDEAYRMTSKTKPTVEDSWTDLETRTRKKFAVVRQVGYSAPLAIWFEMYTLDNEDLIYTGVKGDTLETLFEKAFEYYLEEWRQGGRDFYY